MIAYIYIKESKMIICKIDNVTNIDINGREINGDNIIRFGESQDFVILQSDTINKNIGDIIDLAGIEDCRDYFILGKDTWYLNQLKKQFNTITEQQNKISDLSSDNVSTMLAVTELYEMTLV